MDDKYPRIQEVLAVILDAICNEKYRRMNKLDKLPSASPEANIQKQGRTQKVNSTHLNDVLKKRKA
jgi:hypothetical protein